MEGVRRRREEEKGGGGRMGAGRNGKSRGVHNPGEWRRGATGLRHACEPIDGRWPRCEAGCGRALIWADSRHAQSRREEVKVGGKRTSSGRKGEKTVAGEGGEGTRKGRCVCASFVGGSEPMGKRAAAKQGRDERDGTRSQPWFGRSQGVRGCVAEKCRGRSRMKGETISRTGSGEEEEVLVAGEEADAMGLGEGEAEARAADPGDEQLWRCEEEGENGLR